MNCPYGFGQRRWDKGDGRDNHLAALYPNIAAEWHPTKNGKLTPRGVRPKANKKI